MPHFAMVPSLEPWPRTNIPRDKDAPIMSTTIPFQSTGRIIAIPTDRLKPNPFSQALYGDPADGRDDLLQSIQDHGVLVPLVITPDEKPKTWELISGHRRHSCALALGLATVPCSVVDLARGTPRSEAVIEYNLNRRKTFSQLMREADALHDFWTRSARRRQFANLELGRSSRRLSGVALERRKLDAPPADRHPGLDTPLRGRTDTAIAERLGIGGKDLYRQARAIWKLAQSGDVRAQSGVEQIDLGLKTINAAYKDLRRRTRYSTGFRPTPYDVWSFRQDRAFGIPHPGSIPPAIVAHALYYFTQPGALVVDPMAGGGTTVDVCQAMGRRCLAYDLNPTRPDIRSHDVQTGFPPDAMGCDLVFCDPPYHTMLADKYPGGVAQKSLMEWLAFLHQLALTSHGVLRPGGILALLLAPQTEKDLPAGVGYLDHAFFGFMAAARAGFVPERRISCPMSGAYLPQQVRQARTEGRLLGQVRDLLIFRKREMDHANSHPSFLFLQGTFDWGITSSVPPSDVIGNTVGTDNAKMA